MKIRIVLFVSFVLLAVQGLAQTTPTLNYQGVVTSGGSNYNGTGYFKFVLSEWDSGLWSNDGGAGTNEPSGSISINVDQGLFHTELGDTGVF